MLSTLQVYELDSMVRIRSAAYTHSGQIGQQSQEQNIRGRAIDQLLSGIGDPDAGIVRNCMTSLTGFQIGDFTNEHRLKIVPFINDSTAHMGEVVKLVGFLQIKESIPTLKTLLTETPNSQLKWCIRLALLRMGDSSSQDYFQRKLATVTLSDDFVYDVVPDLVYTRDQQVFGFLESIIQSDEKNCTSADPDRGDAILCGYRVMEYMAYAIEDFPILTDADGEAQIADYEKALEEVRLWFAGNPAYQLRTDRY